MMDSDSFVVAALLVTMGSLAGLCVMAASIMGFGLLLPLLITASVLPSVRAARIATAMVRLMAGVGLGTSLLVVGALMGDWQFSEIFKMPGKRVR